MVGRWEKALSGVYLCGTYGSRYFYMVEGFEMFMIIVKWKAEKTAEYICTFEGLFYLVCDLQKSEYVEKFQVVKGSYVYVPGNFNWAPESFSKWSVTAVS